MNNHCYHRPSRSLRIILLLRSSDDRDRLRKLFLDLAHQRVTTIALRQADWVEIEASCPSIVLKFVTNEDSPQLQKKTTKEGKSLIWSRHEEGWMECAEKMDTLTEGSHQYMGYGDAEIEVSFLEYPSPR
jgi:hypothetical protein